MNPITQNLLMAAAGSGTTATIAVAHSSPPCISVYPWLSGFGTKYANPATLPAFGGNDVKFNPSSTAIAVAHFSSP